MQNILAKLCIEFNAQTKACIYLKIQAFKFTHSVLLDKQKESQRDAQKSHDDPEQQ